MKKPMALVAASVPATFRARQGRDGLKLSGGLADNHIEMNDADHNRQSAPPRGFPPDEINLAFAAFALGHSGCGDEASELRLDERSLIGWCRRCNDSRIFVVHEENRRKQTRPNLVSEGGRRS